MPEENPPNNNPDNSAIEEAVQRGLEKAIAGPVVADAIARILASSESRGGKEGVSHAGNIRGSMLNLKLAQRAGAELGGGASAEAPGGISSTASRGFLGADPKTDYAGRPYYTVPPGFGQFAGTPTAQNFAGMVAERNLNKIAAGAKGEEYDRAVSGFHRANRLQSEIIPMAKSAQQVYQKAKMANDKQEMVRQLGYSQGAGLGAEAQDTGIGPFKFRYPFNPAWQKGMGIGLHQMKEAFGAGINMKQMAAIDGSLMGMGLNFDDKRFRPAEKTMEDIARYNPALDIKRTGAMLEPSARYGGTDELKRLGDTIKGLGQAAVDANVSMDQMQTNMLEYRDFAASSGGGSAFSQQQALRTSTVFQGVAPTKIGQFLQNNPFGRQAAMATGSGFQSYQIGAMTSREQESAMSKALGSSWSHVSGRKMDDPNTAKWLDTEQGRKAIGSLQGLYGFQDFTPDQIKDMVTHNAQRVRSNNATDMLHKALREGGTTHLTKKQVHDYKRDRTEAGSESIWNLGDGVQAQIDPTQQTRAQLDAQLRAAGLRGEKGKGSAGEFIKEHNLGHYDDKGNWYMEKGWAAREKSGFDKLRHDPNSVTGGAMDKLTKALQDGAKYAKDAADAVKAQGQKNGGG